MLPYTIKTVFKMICLFIAVTAERQVVSELNPGCVHCDQRKRPLVYVRAQGSRDTIHQIWDFTNREPAVVYFVGPPQSTLNILWNKGSPDKFEFSHSAAALYSFAATLDAVIEYNKQSDSVMYRPDIPSETEYWPLEQITWHLQKSELTDRKAVVFVRGRFGLRPGAIEMKVNFFLFQDHALHPPHLIHTSNSTLIEMRLVNFKEHLKFNSSRFALRFVLISTDQPWRWWSKSVRKSLNDEKCPGIFDIIEIKTNKKSGGFVQFRPVAHTKPAREFFSSTYAYIAGFDKTLLPRRSILRDVYRDYFVLRYYFRNNESVDLVIQEMFVSFSLGEDYRHDHFIAWSFTIGYGDPPREAFSLAMSIIICTEFVVSALLVLSSVVFMMVQKWKKKKMLAKIP